MLLSERGGNVDMNAIITDHRILRGMETKGFIVRDGSARSTERHWTGRQVKVVTCHEGPKLRHWYDVFTHKGVDYRLRYFDGCFHPFVTRLDADLPSFV